MQYKYVKTPQDYSDLASGKVFYSLPGHPAFPVRLASEIFQRCLASRLTIYQDPTPCTLYDPCCGSAYLLSVTAYLHREHIRAVIGSDIDEKAVAVAKKNLGLLDEAGMDGRMAEITRMIEQYDKDSHREALKSVHILKEEGQASSQASPLETKVFQASATDLQAISRNIQPKSVDIVMTDVPYGKHSHWDDSRDSSNSIGLVLDALTDVLSASSIVAIISDKQQKVSHEGYRRIEKFQVGKRRAVFLRMI